jgi:hypothetical protein
VGAREPSDEQTMILIKCRFPEITYILHAIHHYAAQFTNEVLFVRKVLQFTKALVNGMYWSVELQLQKVGQWGPPVWQWHLIGGWGGPIGQRRNWWTEGNSAGLQMSNPINLLESPANSGVHIAGKDRKNSTSSSQPQVERDSSKKRKHT